MLKNNLKKSKMTDQNKLYKSEKIRILTWHVHGSYLYYLSHCRNCTFFVPVKANNEEGYTRLSPYSKWPANVKEIRAEDVKSLSFDLILFQSKKNYHKDQYEILTSLQRTLPKIYLEHDPPRENPTNTAVHPITDPSVLLVHVTRFNELMWDNRNLRTKVIDHGIPVPKAAYSGGMKKGIVVINNLHRRGRRLGSDLFLKVKKSIPLDLAGIDSERYGGLGDIRHDVLPQFISKYRFFFNPIRYTSLPLSLCEAMMVGMPAVVLATTEVAVTIQDGINGFSSLNLQNLIQKMQLLLGNRNFAAEMGLRAKNYARKRFSIKRFAQEWEDAFSMVSGVQIQTERNQNAPAVEIHPHVSIAEGNSTTVLSGGMI